MLGAVVLGWIALWRTGSLPRPRWGSFRANADLTLIVTQVAHLRVASIQRDLGGWRLARRG